MASPGGQVSSDAWIEKGPLTIRIERDPDELYVVEVYGELDLSCCDALEAELKRIESSDVEQIIIDLSGLDFIDSTGLQILLRAESRSRRDSGRVSFLRGQGAVQRTLDLVSASSVLTFAD